MRHVIAALFTIAIVGHVQAEKTQPTNEPQCAPWMQHSFQQLHSGNTINLCAEVQNKPVLLVNTASHCGFTYQFKGLEELHQRYKDDGLTIVGFSSNDFNQAAKTQAEAASICYENYGVSFTMTAPIQVTGTKAHPLFQHLSQNSSAPKWNFNKYLISADGKKIRHFDSRIAPSSQHLKKAIEQSLANNK